MAAKLSFEPKSSHLSRVEYDPEAKHLFVTFLNGASYRYDGFPREAYDNFAKYRSAGEFHARVVKRYKTVRLDTPKKSVKV